MNFKFQISFNDNDYLEFNKFHLLRSPYGEKSRKSMKSMLTVMLAAFALISLIFNGFSLSSLLYIIPLFVIWLLFWLFMDKFLISTVKTQLRQMKKSGKLPYSQSSILEFYEKGFVEITESNKTELKYTAIERISIVDKKYIYIHTNSIMAYIIPYSVFESDEQRSEFFVFLKSICQNVDLYV